MHILLDTSTPLESQKLTVLQAAQYFLFRDSATEQRKLIQLRVTSKGSAFIVISPREFPLWSSLYVEIAEDEIVFGKYNGIDAKEVDSKAADMTGVLDLWLYFENMFLYIGKQEKEIKPAETIARFFSKQLPAANHLGFTNIGTGEWIVHEGWIKFLP